MLGVGRVYIWCVDSTRYKLSLAHVQDSIQTVLRAFREPDVADIRHFLLPATSPVLQAWLETQTAARGQGPRQPARKCRWPELHKSFREQFEVQDCNNAIVQDTALTAREQDSLRTHIAIAQANGQFGSDARTQVSPYPRAHAKKGALAETRRPCWRIVYVRRAVLAIRYP